MKIQYFVLSGLAFGPVCALAQPRTPARALPSPPPLAVEPAAQELLNRAIQSYKGANGIRYDVQNTRYSRSGKKSPKLILGTVRYSLPANLNISQGDGEKMISDGSSMYLIFDSEYFKFPTSVQSASATMTTQTASGQLIGPMMKGNNPFLDIQKLYFGMSPKQFKSGKVTFLGLRVIDGEVLQGLRYDFSTSLEMSDKTPFAFSEETTAWFGGTPFLLRRVQTRTTSKKGSTTKSEKLVDQELSPTFAPDTFKFSNAGLKPASNKASDPYWDPRLKVGTNPFAFSAKDLQGRPVSLANANYKGKVVLLDFWATWCGPCVAGLPELKGAYDKYHARGLEVVGVSLDEDKNDLTSFIQERKMAWPQLFDGKAWKSSIPTAYGVHAIPFLLLIGKDGKIAAVNPRGNIDKAVQAALAKS